MTGTIEYQGKTWRVNWGRPIDISQPLIDGADQPRCFGADPPAFLPMRGEGWVAQVDQGGSVNAFAVKLNPHGNGTHTECFGHISQNHDSLYYQDVPDHIPAQLVTVKPIKDKEDWVIQKADFEAALREKPGFLAIVIRTLPNGLFNKRRDFTGTNPPYLSVEAMGYLVEKGIQHLLIDLPSVDKEMDNGKVANHKLFWNWPTFVGRKNCTITEMVYVPDQVQDGGYLLNLQRAPFDLDCAPSRPILFPMEKI